MGRGRRRAPIRGRAMARGRGRKMSGGGAMPNPISPPCGGMNEPPCMPGQSVKKGYKRGGMARGGRGRPQPRRAVRGGRNAGGARKFAKGGSVNSKYQIAGTSGGQNTGCTMWTGEDDCRNNGCKWEYNYGSCK